MSKDIQGKAEFIHLAEVFTSQTCNQCKTKNLIPFEPDQNEKYMLSSNVTLVVRYGIVI